MRKSSLAIAAAAVVAANLLVAGIAVTSQEKQEQAVKQIRAEQQQQTQQVAEQMNANNEELQRRLHRLEQEQVSRSQRTATRMMEVTAYTCGPESTGKGPGHPEYRQTTSGYRIGYEEKVIAAPPEIPFGTRIYVPGYGWGVVRDRGGAIKGNRLDIHIEHKSDADDWGRRTIPVKIEYPQ